MFEDKFTLVVALDTKHFTQFMYSYPNWLRFKKELINHPTVIIYDKTQISPRDKRFKQLSKMNTNIRYFRWNPPKNSYNSQRDKMLTALVSAPRFCVDTPWYLQIDTDSFAFDNSKWFDPEWFSSDYTMIASPWRYSKPANAIEVLDDWADNIPELNKNPRLNYPYVEGARGVSHKRIASWIIFCNTEWCSKMANLAGKELYMTLPVPSQDTYFSYCTDRRKEQFLRYKFKRCGWTNSSNTRKLIRNISTL